MKEHDGMEMIWELNLKPAYVVVVRGRGAKEATRGWIEENVEENQDFVGV